MQVKAARLVPAKGASRKRVARKGPLAAENSAERDVVLTWRGRSFVAAATPGEAPAGPLILVEETLDGGGPHVRIVRGDALDVARALAAEGLGREGRPGLRRPSVRVADRVGARGAARRSRRRARRAHVGLRRRSGRARWRVPRHARAAARGAHAPARADARRSGCTSTGALRIWCASLLDEILGRDAFVNEIVWRRAPNLGRQAASQPVRADARHARRLRRAPERPGRRELPADAARADRRRGDPLGRRRAGGVRSPRRRAATTPTRRSRGSSRGARAPHGDRARST